MGSSRIRPDGPGKALADSYRDGVIARRTAQKEQSPVPYDDTAG
jgi:hypothetical protein